MTFMPLSVRNFFQNAFMSRFCGRIVTCVVLLFPVKRKCERGRERVEGWESALNDGVSDTVWLIKSNEISSDITPFGIIFKSVGRLHRIFKIFF